MPKQKPSRPGIIYVGEWTDEKGNTWGGMYIPPPGHDMRRDWTRYTVPKGKTCNWEDTAQICGMTVEQLKEANPGIVELKPGIILKAPKDW